MSVRRLLAFRPRERKFFYKLMLGLLVMAIIPTTITVYVLHHHYVNSMMDEIGGSNKRLLEQAKMNGEMMFNDMTYTASALLSNSQVSFFMQTDYSADAKLFNDLMLKLGNLRSSSRYITSVSLYFNQFEYLIGSDETEPSFFRSREQLDKLGLTALYDKMDLKQNRFYLDSQDGKNNLYMIRPVQNSSYQNVGAIVITVSGAKFRAIFNPIRMAELDTILIVDPSGSKVMCEGSACEDDLLHKYAEGSIAGNYRIVEHGSQQLVVSKSELEFNKWSFISILPIERLTSKLNVFHHLTLLILMIMVAAAVIFSLIYGRYLYRPMRHLLTRMLAQPNSVLRTGGEDEFRLIDQAYHDVLLSKADMEHFIDNNKELMRNKLLHNIVRGREMDEDSIREKLQFFEIKLPFRYVSVVLVKGFQMDAWNDISYQHSAVGKMAVYSRSEQLLESLSLEGVPFELDADTMAVIVNTNSSTCDSVLQFAQAIQLSLKGFPVQIGIGGCMEGLSNLYASYRQARYDLACNLDGPPKDNEQAYMDLSLYEKKIGYGLMTKDHAGVMDAVDEMLERLQGAGPLSWAQVQNMWLQVLSSTMKRLEELNIHVYQEFMNRAIYSQLSSLETTIDTRDWLNQLFHGIIARMLEQEENHATHYKVQLAEQIIKGQYDQELTLEYISEQVGLNAAYFSKLFKDVTGINFIEYVNKIRIDRSKELLHNPSGLPLDDIARRVGYNNTQSFTRFFKKYEACTPGQYRSRLAAVDK
jgi:two-component system response regulator YesN